MQDRILIFDGGTGTVLQSMGLPAGKSPEFWNIEQPDRILNLHKSYIEAGADMIKSNTFGASPIKMGKDFAKYVVSGLEIARKAVEGTNAKVALDIGPTGKLLAPLGNLSFEDAVKNFAEVVKAGKDFADLILIETMNDSFETKAAVLAAKENSDLPIFVTCVYDENKKLMTGANPKAMVAMLEGLGVSALGVNCSLGPKEMKKVAEELIQFSSIPVIVNPTAGLPVLKNGESVFEGTPEEFAKTVKEIAKMGASILGGCCGTTPEYIKAVKNAVKDIKYVPPAPKNDTVISSYTHAVTFGKKPILIGERINPTGKSKLKEALRENKNEYILNEAIGQQEKGADVLDVNAGLPDIDEPAKMEELIFKIQSVSDLPLQIDTSDPLALEKGMRIYNGKPLVNSVNGKAESMEAVFPLVKKYGGAVVALCLDENGIPETAEGRIKIAEKIIETAKKYGIDKKDIIVDALALTISSGTENALVTLETVKKISKMGINTVLGVSNISFGLPQRDIINSTFFALAMENGLSSGIINPYSNAMMKSYYSFLALHNLDENCQKYIEFASEAPEEKTTIQSDETLKSAILKGLKESAREKAKELLETLNPLDVIDAEIIPALDIAGRGFEEKKIFLPQLLMSAEASKEAFDVIKQKLSKSDSSKGKIILATVEGDIHDIGKNIVKVLLENYGFDVIDLGKDVKPEIILNAVIKEKVSLVGLSALMTTTVPAMERTIKLLHEKCPEVKVVVGGAVLTQSYADMISADKYAKDAMETVRYAELLFLDK